MASRAPSGSSISTIRASWARQRASATRCRIAAGQFVRGRVRRLRRAALACSSSSAVPDGPRTARRARSASSTFWRAVSHGSRVALLEHQGHGTRGCTVPVVGCPSSATTSASSTCRTPTRRRRRRTRRDDVEVDHSCSDDMGGSPRRLRDPLTPDSRRRIRCRLRDRPRCSGDHSCDRLLAVVLQHLVDQAVVVPDRQAASLAR